jgi:hypothetical protein
MKVVPATNLRGQELEATSPSAAFEALAQRIGRRIGLARTVDFSETEQDGVLYRMPTVHEFDGVLLSVQVFDSHVHAYFVEVGDNDHQAAATITADQAWRVTDL